MEPASFRPSGVNVKFGACELQQHRVKYKVRGFWLVNREKARFWHVAFLRSIGASWLEENARDFGHFASPMSEHSKVNR